MGTRGPIEKSRIFRIREGASEPIKPAPGASETAFGPLKRPPKAPKWLASEGKALWKRLAPKLVTARLLTAESLPSLEGLCACYGVARQADAVLQHDGLVMAVGENGYQQQRPEMSIAHKHGSLFRQYADSFGLTPSGARRLGLETPMDDEDDPFADLISTV